jgi:hypothetical protein
MKSANKCLQRIRDRVRRLIVVAGISALIGSSVARAQSIPIEWVRQIGSSLPDTISSRMVVDAFGNCIVAGTYASPNSASSAPLDLGITNLPSIGGRDIYLAKYDNVGNLLWARNAGGTNEDFVAGVALDLNGNIFFSGFDSTNGVFWH